MDKTNAQHKAIHAKASKEFGHELAKRPEVFRKHVIAGIQLGTLKNAHGIVTKNKKQRMLNDKDTGFHGNIHKVKGPNPWLIK